MDKEATLHLFWMSDLVDTEDKFGFSNFFLRQDEKAFEWTWQKLAQHDRTTFASFFSARGILGAATVKKNGKKSNKLFSLIAK